MLDESAGLQHGSSHGSVDERGRKREIVTK